MTRRITSMILCVLITCTLVFSLAFIADEADHDCIGDGCEICRVIAVCESFIAELAAAVVVYAIRKGRSYVVSGCFSPVNGSIFCSDPVRLCVKLTE